MFHAKLFQYCQQRYYKVVGEKQCFTPNCFSTVNNVTIKSLEITVFHSKLFQYCQQRYYKVVGEKQCFTPNCFSTVNNVAIKSLEKNNVSH